MKPRNNETAQTQHGNNIAMKQSNYEAISSIQVQSPKLR